MSRTDILGVTPGRDSKKIIPFASSPPPPSPFIFFFAKKTLLDQNSYKDPKEKDPLLCIVSWTGFISSAVSHFTAEEL
jgi:hypothetical protein